MTTANGSAVQPAPRTRACAYCAGVMDRGRGAECPTCGWSVGLMAVGRVHDASGTEFTHFVPEAPGRFSRVGMLVFLLGAFGVFAAGVSENAWIALLGVALLALGIVVAVQTRFGRITYGLTTGPRILAKLTIGVGTVLALCTVVGIFVGMNGDRWIRSQL